MGKMIAGKIDLAKVPGVTIIENTKGRVFADITDGLYHGKNGAQYIDFVLFENEKPEEHYGEDWSIKPSQSKEDREAKKKVPYIGNGKNLGGRSQSQAPRNREQYKTTPAQSESADFNNGDDIPF